MNWILEHLQAAVVIVLVLVSLFKKALEATKSPVTRGEDLPPDREFSSDKSYRKRAPSVPPPLTRPPARPSSVPDALPPVVRMVGYEIESAHESAMILQHQQDLAAQLSQIRENPPITPGGASVTRARIARQAAGLPASKKSLTLRRRLHDPAEVRRAFIMREILDPPVGLR